MYGHNESSALHLVFCYIIFVLKMSNLVSMHVTMFFRLIFEKNVLQN